MANSQIYARAELYDLIMGPGEGPELDFYLGLARAAPGPTLEVACGTGRLTLPMARAGVEIEALDLSAEMLQLLASKAKAEGLVVPQHQADMRDFELGRRFGLLFVPLNSLLHVHTNDDLVRVFERLAAHLLPGGRCAFAVFNPSPQILSRDPTVRHPFMPPIEHPSTGRIIESTETTDYRAASQISRTTVYFNHPGEPPFFSSDLSLRCVYPQELRMLLQAGGLAVERCLGDYAGAPFNDAARMQIVVARPLL